VQSLKTSITAADKCHSVSSNFTLLSQTEYLSHLVNDGTGISGYQKAQGNVGPVKLRTVDVCMDGGSDGKCKRL